MQRGKSLCKRMQRHASEKAGRQRLRGKGKQPIAAKPRQKAAKVIALAVSAWSVNQSCVLAPRLFAAFGEVVGSGCFCPLPLAAAILLLRLHCLCIPLALRLFYPFAFRSHSVFILSTTLCGSGGVGVSVGGVSVGGVSVDGSVGGSAARVAAQRFCPCPLPSFPSPTRRELIFAAAPLTRCSRCLILCPAQSIRSNQIVNVAPFVRLGA